MNYIRKTFEAIKNFKFKRKVSENNQYKVQDNCSPECKNYRECMKRALIMLQNSMVQKI